MQRELNPLHATLTNIIDNHNPRQLASILTNWMTYEFNITHNTGKTIINKVNGILHWLGRYGYHISCDFLPGVRKFAKGLNNIAKTMLGKKIDEPKRPILNIILIEMLKHANLNEQFAVLFQFKFCLRSEHYCTDKGNYLQIKHLQFIPNIIKPTHLAIRTSNDKNHNQSTGVSLDRTVKCCCNTCWKDLCIVHLAQTYCILRMDKPEQALVYADKGPMKYNTMLTIVRKLIRKLGLPPKEYGTHSLRSGGTTELYLSGWSILDIRQFVHWESLQSVLRYIRPNNPDLQFFGYTATQYEIFRRQQREVVDLKLEAERQKQLKIQLDIAKRQAKTNYGKRSKFARFENTLNDKKNVDIVNDIDILNM